MRGWEAKTARGLAAWKWYERKEGGEEMGKNEHIELVFPKLGHFWLDSGLVGLIKLLEELNPNNVLIRVANNALTLSGKKGDVQSALEKTYDLLVERYYNLSTKKQKDDTTSYNFYYDSKNDTFVSFPKRKSVGIAEIIFNKAPRPTGSSIKWAREEERHIEINGKTIKKKIKILPKEYAYLQERLETFLEENALSITTSGLLVDGPNAVKPNVKIKVDLDKTKGKCYICGMDSTILDEANQTIFPFITGSSGVLSFNSETGNPEKVCWKCSLLGKFVPVNGFYFSQSDHLYTFLPYSSSLEKMCDSYDALQDAKYEDPNLYSNFEHPLGPYFQHSFELTFAFLYTLYDKLSMHQAKSPEEESVLDMEAILNLILDKSPLEFVIVHTRKEGSTFSGKMLWPFREAAYFYRLILEIEKRTKNRMKQPLLYLINFNETKNDSKTLLRNKVCERMLKKQTILDLVEYHVFHANLDYFKPLFDMLLTYELLIKEEDRVYKEEQDAAVNLGKRIGMAVGKSDNGKKGDLFALRKSRCKVDFLEQINRLQFKIGRDFIVPPDIYEGKLTDENFQEFKQYCMIAALNSYNAAKSGERTVNKEEENK